MTFDNTFKNSIVWRAFYSSLLNEEEKNGLLESYSYMPNKGYGGIQVANGQQDKAINLLQEYVGSQEFNYYPDYDFISDKSLFCSCYGKFEIEKISDFIKLLIKENITIINIAFYSYNDIHNEYL
jgi:hypothetical protein